MMPLSVRQLRFLVPVRPDRTAVCGTWFCLPQLFAAVTECDAASRNRSVRWPCDSQTITTPLLSDQRVSRATHSCWLCPPQLPFISKPGRGEGEPDTARIIADGLPATCCAVQATKRLRCLVRGGNCGTTFIRARIIAVSTTVDCCIAALGTCWRPWPAARLIRPTHVGSLREPTGPKGTPNPSVCLVLPDARLTRLRYGEGPSSCPHGQIFNHQDATEKNKMERQTQNSPQLHCFSAADVSPCDPLTCRAWAGEETISNVQPDFEWYSMT